MTKQCFPAYSPGLAARMSDPWYRVLRRYRAERVRPYAHAACRWMTAHAVERHI